MTRRRRMVFGSLACLAALHVARPALARAQGDVGFRARLTADTVYVGQQITYELVVTIPQDVRQRLRRNPQYIAPEVRAMLAYDLPTPRAGTPDEGTAVHTFRRALFPLTAGRYDLAPADLNYVLPQGPSFFSREDDRTKRSEATAFIAIDPPTIGRPSAWGGAVGTWRAVARLDAREARVGDPLVLTLRVEGTGNAILLPRPEISIPWANVVTEGERVVLDSTPTTLRGAKEFSWLVTPSEPGPRTVPPIAYAFFDPSERRYEVARTTPIPVRVLAGDLVALPTRRGGADSAAPLPIRANLAGATRFAFPGATLLAWVALLMPLPWVVARLRGRTPRPVRERSPAELLRDAKGSAAPRDVRALLEAAILRRTGIALGKVTLPGTLARALRREGVTDTTAAAVEALRDDLDAGAYAKVGGSSGRGRDLRERARALVERIEGEARKRAGAVVLLALLVGAACAAPRPSGEQAALMAFAEGQTAYMGQDWSRARDAFLRAANGAPRDHNAWMNLGTAGWQAGDTAAAVLGWQRALRLDPVAGAPRALLARVRAPQARGAARVLPLPTLPLTAVAFGLWCAGWAWAARRRWRRLSARRSLALLAPAIAIAALAAVGEWQMRATDLVVIATPVPLRSLPALGAEPSALPLVGEVVRVRERRGVWLRIVLDAGRAGWYPEDHTYPLRRD